jgi:hypothetical protein
MKIPKEGQVLKYRQTGELFEVRKIARGFVILHSRDGISQVMTGKKSLHNSFEKIRKRKDLVSPLGRLR